MFHPLMEPRCPSPKCGAIGKHPIVTYYGTFWFCDACWDIRQKRYLPKIQGKRKGILKW